MKKVVLFLCALLWFTQLVQSQPKQKAEKEFLKELNSILSNSKDTDFWHKKGTMTIDSKFTISDKGILSVTVKYTAEDATFARARMEAAVSKIIDVAYDHYLILEFKDDDVTFYESEVSSYELKEVRKTNYFHIGTPAKNGYKQQEKLQRLLNKLLKFYTK